MKKTSYTLHEARKLLKQIENDLRVTKSVMAKHTNRVILGRKEAPAYVDKSVHIHAGVRYNIF